MGKQTMGTPCHSLRYRSDNKLYAIRTPQAPIVRPTMHDYYKMDDYPLGTNAIVAVISYTVRYNSFLNNSHNCFLSMVLWNISCSIYF